jgi:hypothetical protein
MFGWSSVKIDRPFAPALLLYCAMEWLTDDQLAKAAFERVVRSVQTQIELE